MSQNKRVIYSAVISLIASAINVCGQILSEKLDTSFISFGVRWRFAFFVLVLLGGTFSFLYWALGKRASLRVQFVCSKRVKIVTLSAILISYGIWIVAFYPGFMNYDGGNQLIQVLYEEVPYDAHHPLFHTLIIGWLVKIGYSIYNVDLSLGIFTYICFQLIVSGICFWRIVLFAYKRAGKVATIVSTTYFCVFPTIVIFGLSTTKDVLCYAFLSLAVLGFFELYSEDCTDKKKWILSAIFLILSCLIRRNIVYAVIVFAIILLFIDKERCKAGIITCLFVVVVSSLVDKALIISLDAVPVSFNEANSIVYQQLARTYVYEGKEAFDSNELERLYSFSSGDEGLRYYDPVMADYTKSAFGANYELIKANKWELYSLWIKKGFQYPKTYAEAFLYNTYQAWYPLTIVKEARRYRYFDITNWMENTCRKSFLWDALAWIYECKYRNVPVLRTILSTGTWMLVMFAAWIKGMCQKNKSVVVALALPLLVTLTSFLGPVSDVRYYLILFYLAPLSCLILFGKN